jgi:hypothetical protein
LTPPELAHRIDSSGLQQQGKQSTAGLALLGEMPDYNKAGTPGVRLSLSLKSTSTACNFQHNSTTADIQLAWGASKK